MACKTGLNYTNTSVQYRALNARVRYYQYLVFNLRKSVRNRPLEAWSRCELPSNEISEARYIIQCNNLSHACGLNTLGIIYQERTPGIGGGKRKD